MPIEPEIDLAKGVHLAWIHEDIVILDVQADAYSLLVGAAISSVLRAKARQSQLTPLC